MILPIFQLFGSASSLDVDIVFFVDQLDSVKASSMLSKNLGQQYATWSNCGKIVNANLAILGADGHLVEVYKGTTDELNNALIATYDFHEQAHAQQIQTALPRDINLKVLRCARVVLSFLSRTKIRAEVKMALRGDLLQKLNVLDRIRLNNFDELGKNGGVVEFYKTVAFQLGQTLALMAGDELYTKAAVANYYPSLAPYLWRDKTITVDRLQAFLQQFVLEAQKMLPQFKNLYEYRYILSPQE